MTQGRSWGHSLSIGNPGSVASGYYRASRDQYLLRHGNAEVRSLKSVSSEADGTCEGENHSH